MKRVAQFGERFTSVYSYFVPLRGIENSGGLRKRAWSVEIACAVKRVAQFGERFTSVYSYFVPEGD